jgi:transposase
VLSVLAGEMTIAEAARREKASGQSIGRWKADFLEAAETALTASRSRPPAREQQLEAEVAGLTQALGCWSAPEVVSLWAYLDSTCPAGLGPAVSASRAACQAESPG